MSFAYSPLNACARFNEFIRKEFNEKYGLEFKIYATWTDGVDVDDIGGLYMTMRNEYTKEVYRIVRRLNPFQFPGLNDDVIFENLKMMYKDLCKSADEQFNMNKNIRLIGSL